MSAGVERIAPAPPVMLKSISGCFSPSADVAIGKSFVLAGIRVSGARQKFLEPDPGSDSFPQGVPIRFATCFFDNETQQDIARVAVQMPGVGLKIRLTLSDTGHHFILCSRLLSP